MPELAGGLLRRLVGALGGRGMAGLRRGAVAVTGRVAWPGACADRLPGERMWTLRVTLADATLGQGARLGEPLHLHCRCDRPSLDRLLAALEAGACIEACIEIDRGTRMQARLRRLVRVEPAPRSTHAESLNRP